MAFLNYEYKMKIAYSEPVDKCYYTIKSIPTNDFRQRSISYDIKMTPESKSTSSNDSFGNSQIIGCVNSKHSEFEFIIKGLVETYNVNTSGGVNLNTAGMYKYPYGKCIPGDNIKAYADELKGEVSACDNVIDKCLLIMNRLHEKMEYVPGSTEIDTTAEDSFSRGHGVCQDFSHIFICLLRLFNIPARYVCGLIVGEGKSHAWVEAISGENYVAFDPTNNKCITDEYIKLGVGRDAFDCSINRGVMWGGGTQTQEISVNVQKYY